MQPAEGIRENLAGNLPEEEVKSGGSDQNAKTSDCHVEPRNQTPEVESVWDWHKAISGGKKSLKMIGFVRRKQVHGK